MRPVPFFIEIPDRPVYQPGSGPTMAPITLQPDDSDTGWVIDGTVEFQGVVQYVVMPADNPAHRRPVKKQHILDWVSAKAYEDFEYSQYKRQIDEEKERESRILAKAAAFREKRFGKGYARDGRKARKPFAKYMQLEPVEDSDTGITSGHLSSPEHSTDEMDRNDRPEPVKTAKRKRSVGMGQDNALSVKRRGFSDTNTQSLMWKPWQPSSLTPYQHLQAASTEGRENTEVGAETTLNTPDIEWPRLESANHPTLSSPRQAATLLRALEGPERPRSPFSAPSKFVPASSSPLRLSPRMNWSTIGPSLRVKTNRLRSASPLDLSSPQASTKSGLAQASWYERDYAPLRTPKLSRLAAPIAQFESFGRTQNGTGEPLKYSKTKREQTAKSPGNGAMAIGDRPRRRAKNANPDILYDETLSQNGDVSFIKTGRVRHKLSNDGGPSRKMGERSSSNSSGSSNVLRWPSNQTGSKATSKQSKYFAKLGIVPQDTDDTGDEMEVDSEVSWEIDGILDDQLRRVDGILVRHYLCEWAGDYEPTWEPKENISAVALQKYENKKEKKRRNDIGFDGAADITLEKLKASSSKSAQMLVDEVQNIDEASDSGDFMDALSDTANFLTPPENPRAQSRADSVAGGISATRIAL